MERSSLFLFCIRRHCGITLIEALVTLVAVSVIVTMAITSIRAFLLNNRMTVRVNTLVADLVFARSEAIKRSTMVTVCQSSSGTNCTRQDAWHEGWIVFADPNQNHRVDTTETILRIARPSMAGNLRYQGTVDHFVHYQSSGMGWPAGQFTFCDIRGPGSAKFLIINNVGRPRVSRTSANDGAIACP